jgi:hypothetical protein
MSPRRTCRGTHAPPTSRSWNSADRYRCLLCDQHTFFGTPRGHRDKGGSLTGQTYSAWIHRQGVVRRQGNPAGHRSRIQLEPRSLDSAYWSRETTEQDCRKEQGCTVKNSRAPYIEKIPEETPTLETTTTTIYPDSNNDRSRSQEPSETSSSCRRRRVVFLGERTHLDRCGIQSLVPQAKIHQL